MPRRIVQLTDLHLLADPHERLKAVPTRETLADVLDHVRAEHPDFDLLVLTGDLAHDEREECYLALREMLGDWVSRCRLIPGNHDSRGALRRTFSELFPGDGCALSFSADLDGWRLIGVDSQVPGQVPGRIAPAQLDWLHDELSQEPERPTLVFVHHPPIPVGSPWLDRIGLEDADEFGRLIEASPQVRAVVCGHVHHEFRGRLGHATVLATPSTAVQFEPRAREATYAALPPGYRVFELNESGFETRVVRLPELRFPPVK